MRINIKAVNVLIWFMAKSVFSVSDAVALQNEWTFARANRLATSLFRKVKAFHTIHSREFYYYLGFDIIFSIS